MSDGVMQSKSCCHMALVYAKCLSFSVFAATVSVRLKAIRRNINITRRIRDIVHYIRDVQGMGQLNHAADAFDTPVERERVFHDHDP